MTDDHGHAPRELARHECWELLRAAPVGRLSVVVDGAPDIFPLNYVVDHGSIVFRTAPGTKLAAIADGDPVAFEADGAGGGEAWSVVVKGGAVRIDQPYEILDATELPLYPWQEGSKPHFVRIEATEVTGRRFPVVGPGGEPHPDTG